MVANQNHRPSIVLVGGFLGAGKTSLILAAARILEQRGLRCAVILNDQGEELVDTSLAAAQRIFSREVTGGCFCCRFSALLEVIDEVCAARQLDVIFAEPVGSCTDLSATVLGPLREESHRYCVAPFTVLVDPARAAELSNLAGDSDMAFLFRKQLQEADLICNTKADLYPEKSWMHDVKCRRLCAKTGEGVSEWLDEVLFGSLEAGKTTLDIDYARYAQAEAALAWLNLSFVLSPATPVPPATAVGPLLDDFDRALTTAAIQIVHLKIFDSSPTGWLKAAICANGQEPTVEGALDASPAARHEMLINLRAKGDPAQVQTLVENQLRRLEAQVSYVRLDCFSPAAPKPERRIAKNSF
jgi:hypothetical protein